MTKRENIIPDLSEEDVQQNTNRANLKLFLQQLAKKLEKDLSQITMEEFLANLPEQKTEE